LWSNCHRHNHGLQGQPLHVPFSKIEGAARRGESVASVVTLEVADTGPRIPPELQERIFEPFFTTKPPGVGTGLGLPFCRGIIDGHGGTINVESQVSRGAVFRIKLPVEAVPVTVSETLMPEALLPVKGKAILIIDDELGIPRILPVPNTVRGPRDAEAMRSFFAHVGLPFRVFIPADEMILEADRLGQAPLDHDAASPAVAEIARLADALSGN
jgi:hypothetical protein